MPRPFIQRDSTFPCPDSAYFASDAPRRPPITTAPDGPSWLEIGVTLALVATWTAICFAAGILAAWSTY